MKVLCILLFIIEFISIVKAVNWQPGNWAMSCDFNGNDLSNQKSRGEDCSGVCSKTAGCTHFTWTTNEGGTCWMKQGKVTKEDAFSTSNRNMVCGIVRGVIDWQTGNWAKSCYFYGNDLSNQKTRREDCGGICRKTTNCTHFTYEEKISTCWMKTGQVTKKDALSITDRSIVCGMVSEFINWKAVNLAKSCNFLGIDISNQASKMECGIVSDIVLKKPPLKDI